MKAVHLRLSAFICGCLLFALSAETQQKPVPAKSPGVTVSAGLTKEELQAEAAVNEAMKAGRKALAAKDCPRAIASFRKAIEQSQARALSASRRGAFQQSALKEIADCQFAAKQFDEAEATLLRRKEVLLEWAGPFDSAVGDNALELAAIQIERQKFSEAERHAREAIAVYDAGIARFRRTRKPEEQDLTVDITRSKVTGLYMLGLSLALQRRADDALKVWDEAYRLGVKFESKPETLEQMLIQAVEVHDMLKITASRALWVERLRQLRSPQQKR